MILRDRDGDYWEELESGLFACLTRNMEFRTREFLETFFGPLVEYKEVPQ